MRQKITKKVKTRDEILNTIKSVDQIGNKTIGVLKSNNTLNVDISNWLWTLCDKVIEVNTTPTRSHIFDYNYFDFPSEDDERTEVPVVYFMEEWLEDVELESVVEG